MVLITQSGPETLSIGGDAPDFNLPGTDGKNYSLASFEGSKAVVISFTCNHCPYAVAYEDRFISLAKEFGPKDVAFLAICCNDAENYPQDNFENMKKHADQAGFNFPYLRDDSQDVAKAYGAVCTPHLFLLDGARKLVYEGRIDDNWQDPGSVKSQDLRTAIEAVLAGNPVTNPNTNPMGCSIKWK
ncbi:MAG: thioredoxin family protein [Verrucomicrobia bacterium]|nr:thioredoxin family protein [Verrucomicrobiota bacterium]